MNFVLPLCLLGGAVVGACGGSFVGNAVVRAERCEQVLTGRSHCDHCKTLLPLHQTIPVISYLQHRGVCRSCAQPIAALHLWGELGGAAIMALLILLCSQGAQSWTTALFSGALGFVLLGLGLYDLRTLRLPDPLVASVLALGLILAWIDGRLVIGLLAAITTFLILALVQKLSRKDGEPALGFGDVKLLAALAVWLGLDTPIALILACILALAGRLATRAWGGRAAFGPAIAGSAWLVGMMAGRGL